MVRTPAVTISFPGQGPAIAKRAVWLAYQAARIHGMGRLQAIDDATENSVWRNEIEAGDYPGNFRPPEGEVHADYVFGRMLKLNLCYDANFVWAWRDETHGAPNASRLAGSRVHVGAVGRSRQSAALMNLRNIYVLSDATVQECAQ